MIEIKDLAKIYNTEHGEFKAIENINLTIEDGDIFGIIGMSGAGKSTLLRCINLLERPTLGQILIDGQDVTSLDGKALLQLRRKIGMIFQRFNLLMQRTVEENVSYPLEVCGYPKEKRAERVAELLELVDLFKGKELSGTIVRRTAAESIDSEGAGQQPSDSAVR